MAEIVQQIQKRMIISLAAIAKSSSLDIKEGDYLLFEEREDGILLRPVVWQPKEKKVDS
ncbi:hypothetical protein DFQ01_110117 [Paenibacillus cellulosilyticus]|uniref:AbrB family looped-hinge helix DNA binding protein n=1 Tax=Paenibacillus cellulosilyticus TaxID=375489 RepID=A0A2V2YSQ1_9BACL|nr:AbrB/MazE/SpoVT family DNA-binding domain-containing protein [Paenibacillus cellulosilyticus]PWW01227.1 hypothetical protein DFQ01_110117 [Paenibacillus cellulosilyticus]QKS46818.1 AbrB/MazE/SpoVT family DNA-binding domain-containing protein [Paenibacillus cellulosilyticus]